MGAVEEDGVLSELGLDASLGAAAIDVQPAEPVLGHVQFHDVGAGGTDVADREVFEYQAAAAGTEHGCGRPWLGSAPIR